MLTGAHEQGVAAREFEIWSNCLQEELFIKFAEFEERCKEHDRARAIYRYALDHIPKNQADAVYQRFVAFEKQHGDREGIEVSAHARRICCCSGHVPSGCCL